MISRALWLKYKPGLITENGVVVDVIIDTPSTIEESFYALEYAMNQLIARVEILEQDKEIKE